MSRPPPRRCNLYYTDGTPRKLRAGGYGCPLGSSCRFVHPEDSLWKDLLPSNRQPPAELVFDVSPMPLRHRSRSRSRESLQRRPAPRSRPSSPAQRRPSLPPPPASAPTLSGQSRAPQLYRRSTSPDRRSSDGGRRYERTPPRVHASSSDVQRVGGHQAWTDDRRAAPRLAAFATLPTGSSHSPSSMSLPFRSNFTQPPAPPPQRVPLPPPPPLPRSPPFLSSENGAPPRFVPVPPEPTLQEKRESWAERIKRLSDCLVSRAEYNKVEAEIRRLRRLRQSWRYADLDESTQATLNAQLTQMELQCEKKKSEYSAAFTHLAESELWPTLHRPDVKAAEEKHRELMASAAELRDTLVELDRTIKTYLKEHTKDVSTDDGMKVDPSPQLRPRPPPPSSKWQPVPAAANTDKREHIDIRPPGQPVGVVSDESEFELIQDRLVTLEGQASYLENVMVQQQRDFMDEVEGLLEVKLEEMDERTAAATKSAEASTETSYAQKLSLIEESLTVMGNQVSELATDMAGMIQQATADEAELAQLKLEAGQLKAQDIEKEEKILSYVQTQEKNMRELHALDSALQAYVDQPPPPPPSIPPEDIARAVEAPLLEIARNNMRAQFEEFRANVDEMLNQRYAEVYKAVWAKLGLTLEMVEVLARHLQLEEAGEVPDP